MTQFQTSPGMRDVLPPESARRRRFVETFAEVAGDAGYGELVTPLLEDYGVFARVGDATDLVQKEMYRFTDNGGRDVALRPEFTAAVCRAFAEHRPATPWKVWSGGRCSAMSAPSAAAIASSSRSTSKCWAATTRWSTSR